MGAPFRSITQLQVHFEARLLEALAGAGWSVRRLPETTTDRPAVLLAERGKSAYAVVLRTANASRQRELTALLADAWLRARWSSQEQGKRAEPLAIVGAPSLSDSMTQTLSEYAGRYLPHGGWGILDGSGKVELYGRGLGLRIAPRAQAARHTPSPPSDAFSDLGQWVLKVLLAPDIPQRLITGPRGRVKTARELADVADVSVPTATRMVRRLREDRFLADEPPLQLHAFFGLLQRWQSAATRGSGDARYRWLLPPADPRKHLARQLARYAADKLTDGDVRTWRSGPRACLGLFAACDQLGLGIVRGVVSHLYVEATSTLTDLGLHPAEPGEQAHVQVRLARFPESIFRANVFPDGVPTADVIQCWLDTSGHPSRGDEQARYLLAQVLEPNLGRAL